MSDPADLLRAYVRAALALQGYEFSEQRIAEITLQFSRIEAIAQTLLPPQLDLGAAPDLGPAAVFRP